MRNLKELATQGLVFLVVSGGPHRKAFAFKFVDKCDMACGRVQCFGQAELHEIGLALPSVNVRDIVAGKAGRLFYFLETKGNRGIDGLSIFKPVPKVR